MSNSRTLADLATTSSVDSSGNIAFDTSSLYIDTVNNRVGIKTSSPSVELEINGSLKISGTGQRITGDFSNATIANRLMFQTSTADSFTVVAAIPNGINTAGGFSAYGSSDTTNTSTFSLITYGGVDARLNTSKIGTGTYLPMTFYTGGSERVRIVGGTGSDVGNVLIGTDSAVGTSAARLQIVQPSTAGFSVASSTTPTSGASFAGWDGYAYDGSNYFAAATINFRANENWSSTNHGSAIQFKTTTSGNGGTLSEKMRIDNAGNLLVGATSTIYSSKAVIVGTADVSTTDFLSSKATLLLTPESNSVANKSTIILRAIDAANQPCAGSIHVEPTATSYRGNLVATYMADGSGGNFIINQFHPTNATTYERARIDSDGVLSLTQGQIKFPATQVASADANTLDDYEEGTFTPSFSAELNCSGTTFVSGTSWYVKVGGIVCYSFRALTTVTTANTKMYFSYTLPFVQASTSDSQGGCALVEGPSPYPYATGVVVDTSSGSHIAFLAVGASALNFNGASTVYVSGQFKAS